MFVVFCRRRRVGKTKLITEFIKDKEAIYFSALYVNAKEKRVVFVIDEYPYLAASFKGISSLLQQLPDFMGQVFEEICIQYLWKMNLAGSIEFSNAERWWGTNPLNKRQEEIDIIAYDDLKMIFCECKWRNEKLSRQIMDNLIEKANMFHGRQKRYILFSKSGFTEECLKLRDEETIQLVSFEEFCKIG